MLSSFTVVHSSEISAGSFKRIEKLIGSRPLRLICVNRRGYPGSTPYSSEDVKALAGESSESERAAMLARHGIDIAFFVDGLIQKLSLTDVGVLAWSIGNTFLLAFLASITSLPNETRERLGSKVKTIILLGTSRFVVKFRRITLFFCLVFEEPPSKAVAIPDPPKAYVPVNDETIPPEDRGAAFVQWVSSYYVHCDISSHDVDQLNYRDADPLRKPTIANMTSEEMDAMTDFSAVEVGEMRIFDPPFDKALSNQKDKALFNIEVRRAWREAKVWLPWGDANTWSIILTVWGLEKEDKEFQKAHNTGPYINFRFVDGGNHFVSIHPLVIRLRWLFN
jgi:pimeloyl-ACP methyl ester carboxylesterase